MLIVLNERLGARFDPDLFGHRAVYNDAETRIEMWLDSRVEQEVYVPGLDVSFEEREGMRTEISAKFTTEPASRMLDEAGLEALNFYTDDRTLFGLILGKAS